MDYIQYEPQRQMICSLETQEERQMGLFLHLSQFLGFVIPFGGIAAPIVLWQIKRNEMPALDAHGKMIVNWAISSVIYAVVSFLLIFVFLIGIPCLLALGVMSIAYPIIGAVKANNGEYWEYPLTINFLK